MFLKEKHMLDLFIIYDDMLIILKHFFNIDCDILTWRSSHDKLTVLKGHSNIIFVKPSVQYFWEGKKANVGSFFMIPNDILIISKQFPFVAVGVRLQRAVLKCDSHPMYRAACPRPGGNLRPLCQGEIFICEISIYIHM